VTERFDLVVRSGTLVTGAARFEADVGVVAGRIAEIAAQGHLSGSARDEIDASGLFVLPGVIDCHVHFREPGLEYKEDWSSGSRSAVMGGVTTVLEMPNTRPPTSTADLVNRKRELAERKSYCDFGLYGLVAEDNLEDLEPMASAGIVGYKCFLGQSTGAIPPPDDGALLDAMRVIRDTGLRIGFHAENNAILQRSIGPLKAAGRTDPLAHVDARPVVVEVEAIQRAALFACSVGNRIHIFHLSSADGLATIEDWRRRGVDITCETTPHYCFLSSEDMRRTGSLQRMNPPVREPGHAEVLLRGLADGRVDAVATDHSPHLLDEKRKASIWDVESGFAGVETSLRLFRREAVNAGKMTLESYVLASSERPARAWGLYPRKGALLVSADADFTVIDLNRRGVIDAARMHGKNNHNPYEGRATQGEAVATVVGGQVIMREGELVGTPRGRMLRPARA
jgi:dihydroorotase